MTTRSVAAASRVAQYVVHDRGVRILEALVGLAQVAVRVDVQDPERRMPRPQRPEQAVGGRVVAAHEAHEPTRIEPARCLRLDVGVHRPAAFVHAPDLADDRIVIRVPAPFQMVDHPFGIAAKALRLLLQGIVHVGRGNAPTPGAGCQRIVEIQLRGGLDDRIRRIRRTGPVGDRHVPRRRDQHQFRLLRLERQSEIASVGHAHSIRVECSLFHNVLLKHILLLTDKGTNFYLYLRIRRKISAGKFRIS